MTLEEAKANYERAKLRFGYGDRRKFLQHAEDSAALDAAVRDFGLATIDGCSAYHGNRLEFMQRTMKAEINRVFGKVLEEKP